MPWISISITRWPMNVQVRCPTFFVCVLFNPYQFSCIAYIHSNSAMILILPLIPNRKSSCSHSYKYDWPRTKSVKVKEATTKFLKFPAIELYIFYHPMLFQFWIRDVSSLQRIWLLNGWDMLYPNFFTFCELLNLIY